MGIWFEKKIDLENSMPVLSGWFPSREGGEERESRADALSNAIPCITARK